MVQSSITRRRRRNGEGGGWGNVATVAKRQRASASDWLPVPRIRRCNTQSSESTPGPAMASHRNNARYSNSSKPSTVSSESASPHFAARMATIIVIPSAPAETRVNRPSNRNKPPKKLNPRHEWGEDVRQRNSPSDEIVRHLGQIIEFAPAAPHKHPADRDASKERGQPGQMMRNALRPFNQPSDEKLHGLPLRIVGNNSPRTSCLRPKDAYRRDRKAQVIISIKQKISGNRTDLDTGGA